ncbi:uncharacterized protein LOC113507332 isoform X2 [Trichoplusia ni]|uniref:Uncharacterized protein LOC113507332 isoform X2 n=1 Tax=Trichoplusia ni TaxID=7111 RepID=A0A7E5X0P8_TRINI|nr:uncharacterized protein LOC113507332 isoform X2 [Trichoplusia ni]
MCWFPTSKGTTDKEEKDLIKRRASYKCRLMEFSDYIYNELQLRLVRRDGLSYCPSTEYASTAFGLVIMLIIVRLLDAKYVEMCWFPTSKGTTDKGGKGSH